MIGLLLENEADCLIRQHTEPRGGPPKNRTRWPEPLPRERFRSSATSGRSALVSRLLSISVANYHCNRRPNILAERRIVQWYLNVERLIHSPTGRAVTR